MKNYVIKTKMGAYIRVVSATNCKLVANKDKATRLTFKEADLVFQFTKSLGTTLEQV